MKPQKHSYPALVLRQNKQRFYFTTIPVSDLFRYCFVARRDEDPDQGFQRVLNRSRAEDIAQYLKDGSGSIPTNVVLSAQADTDFSYSGATKQISFARRPSSFLVLDGQHRLWGYHLCLEKFEIDLRVPCAIYSGLDRTMETKLFVDINTLQRGVPAALLLDIKGLAQTESDLESELRDLFDRLNSDKHSALFGKLSPAKAVKNKINRVTFNRSIGRALKGTALAQLGKELRYGLIKNYVNAVDAANPRKSLMTSPAFFEAIFEVLDNAVERTLTDKKNLKQKSLQEIFGFLEGVNLEPEAGRSRLTPRSISDVLRTNLQQKIAISQTLL